jgi:hypothetical protein
MGVLSCANGTTDPDGGGYDVTVTITGIPEEAFGLICAISVLYEDEYDGATWGIEIHAERVTKSSMTGHYNFTEDDMSYLQDHEIADPNGSYWIGFDIYVEGEDPYRIDFITKTAIQFSSGKATVDLSYFVEW